MMNRVRVNDPNGMSNETSSFLSNPSTLVALTEQFRQRYPMGVIVSELITIHQNEYVVRASVQIGGVVCSTGMAAAASIELAEDRAKERSLHGLGLNEGTQIRLDLGTRSLLSSPSSPAAMSIPQEVPHAVDDADSTLASPVAPDRVPVPVVSSGLETSPKPLFEETLTPPSPLFEETLTPPSPLPEEAIAPPPSVPDLSSFQPLDLLQPLESPAPELSQDFDERSLDSDIPSFLENSSSLLLDQPPEPAPAKKTKPTKATKTDAPKAAQETPDSQDSQDFSDIIAKIDVEMMRLGWNASKGREHLKTVYGKRSRQQLSYAELLDFLAHLEAQAS